MKLHAVTALLTLAGAHVAHARHGHARRQAPPPVSSPSAASSSSLPVSSATTHSASGAPPASTTAGVPPTTSGPAGPVSASASSATASVSVVALPPGVTLPAPQNGVPALQSINSGMPPMPTLPVKTTYKPGTAAPIPGAPPLPKQFVFKQGDWPAQDKVPETNTPQVQEWMKELQGFNIPNYTPTKDGSCAGDPAAAAEAAQRGWWTCGGFTRDTDITACPDKYTWGVSFDDGPGLYTQLVLVFSWTLLNYLDEKNIHATFFVVGSRVIERPDVLIEEYMKGHELSVHTWSHRPLTSLTNEQIVAELGWTRAAIKAVLGVTPTSMRPPFGDMDDRVRAISLAMGMTPIIWTRTPSAGQFDTNDWKVAGGLVSGVDSYLTFQGILGNASLIDTGFIVLQHDLYAITVDLALGYTLNAAVTHNPPFTLKPIGQCMKIPATDMYRESTTNQTFPYHNVTTTIDADGDGKPDSAVGTSAGQNSASGAKATVALPGAVVLAVMGLATAGMFF
ncbi:glycoside hydrolase/deacetylase [Dentipellis sp. KUC8613]|nr:glycoside hydrolase/deacetylase [Dentipellis sp. KUC8613]